MAKAKQSQEKVKKSSVRKQVAEKLSKDFENLKKIVGNKNFNKRIKKASKILSEGVEKKASAKPTKTKKPVKVKKSAKADKTAADKPAKSVKPTNKKTVS